MAISDMTPLPQSTTTLTGRARRWRARIAAPYAGRMACSLDSRADTRPVPLGFHAFAERRDRRAVERLAREHKLESVEFRRVVRPGDLHATIDAQRLDREIQRGRRNGARGRSTAAPVEESPAAKRRGKAVARWPVVAPHGEARGAPKPLAGGAPERTAEVLGEFRRQLTVDDATDVVLAKYGPGDFHSSAAISAGRRAARSGEAEPLSGWRS